MASMDAPVKISKTIEEHGERETGSTEQASGPMRRTRHRNGK